MVLEKQFRNLDEQIEILKNKGLKIEDEDYAKEVCTIDKLEYEGTDEEGKKELEKEREENCKSFYMIDKREKKEINKTNINNFLISLSTTIVLLITIHILNKKM